MSYVVGIAGGTGAGKTAIARTLVDRVGGCLIGLDSYYVDRNHLTPDERNRVNYDEPAAIEMPLLFEHLRCLKAGRVVKKPVYSFETHTRIGVDPVAPKELVVVEGLFTLWWETVREVFDFTVFVDAPSDVRLDRRIRRDVMERGRTAEQVTQQYVATAQPMHDRYVAPTRDHADLVVVNDRDIAHAVEQVIATLRARIT